MTEYSAVYERAEVDLCLQCAAPGCLPGTRWCVLDWVHSGRALEDWQPPPPERPRHSQHAIWRMGYDIRRRDMRRAVRMAGGVYR